MENRLLSKKHKMFCGKIAVGLAVIMAITVITPVSARASTDYFSAVFQGDTSYLADFVNTKQQSIGDERFTLTLEQNLVTDNQALLVYSFCAKTPEAVKELNSEEFFSERAINFAPSNTAKAQNNQWRNVPIDDGRFDTADKKYFLLQCENTDNKAGVDFYLTTNKIKGNRKITVPMKYKLASQTVQCGDVTVKYNPLSVYLRCPFGPEDDCEACQWNGTYFYFRMKNNEIKTFNQLYRESYGEYVNDNAGNTVGWESFSWAKAVTAPENIKSIIIDEQEYAVTNPGEPQAVQVPDSLKPFNVNACVTDYVCLPLREFCNRAGADIRWDSRTYSAIVKYGNSEYVFKNGATVLVKDGAEQSFYNQGIFIDKSGRMMVPGIAIKYMGLDGHGFDEEDEDGNPNPHAKLHILP